MHTKPRTGRQPLKAGLLVLAIASAALLDVPAATIPNVPPLTSTSAEPNIMMILDDSGSMQWEMLPDDYADGYFVYPRPSGVYGSSDYDNRVATFENGQPYNAVARSPQINRVYYDPSITYKPWSQADGSLMPNAAPSCAPHNPMNTALGCRDLATNNTQSFNALRCSSDTSCSWGPSGTQTFWPATYFRYNGGDIWNWSSYTRIDIRPTTATYTGDGRNKRTDCASAATATCTYSEEIQNFANWYTYYRSRVLTARAGIGRAFAAQGSNLRPGFAAINKGSTSIDGVNTRTVILGVRRFTGTDRTTWFNELYTHPIPAAGTPLRQALDDVGQYFSRTDSKGPWSTTPGQSGGTDYTCRQSYTIMMTDGYWNGNGASTAGAQANNDGTAGPTITGPNGQTYTYAAVSPFKDSHSNTLADVAMYYWKRDLRTDLANEVPTNYIDPAFWQHMVTFGVGLGVSGSVDPTTAFRAIFDGTTINWPDPTSSNAARLDDLLHASVNGRGGFFSAKNPTDFAKALSDTLNNIVSRNGSASNVAANSTSISTDSQVFQAKFESGKWSGELEARAISGTGVASTPTWTASANIPAPTSRRIFTRSGGTAVAFTWANLSSSDRTALGSSDVVDYLRGVRSKELQNGGTLRNRPTNNILGDIVDSSPVYVKDNNTVFVGANDGMLHAFDASTGVERFAYIPGSLIGRLQALTDPAYAHAYYVNGNIAVSNKSDTGGHNYLVATLGAGGKGVFGLDATTPGSFAATDVKWEYTDGASDNDLGYMLGQPIIAKMNDGSWSVIVANGYNSTNQRAVLYIFDLATGALKRKLDTGVGGDNGLSSPGVADVDGNGTVDIIYAGDLKGNLWKFDVSANAPSGWTIAHGGSPFFVAKDASNNRQPITAPVTTQVNYLNTGDNAGKRFIFFGTGSYFRDIDPTDTQVQTWYGLVDDTTMTISGRSELKQRSIQDQGTYGGSNVRTFSAATANDMAGKKGWYIDFSTSPGERIVTASTMYRSAQPVLVTASRIPQNDPCKPGGTGYVNAVNAFTGARLDFSFFDVNDNNAFTDDVLNGNPIGSVDLGVGMPTNPLLVGTRLVVGGSSGGLGSIRTNFPNSFKGRISWREIIKD